MNTQPIASANAIRAQLVEKLSPTTLEVLDESHQHTGHTGANKAGYGSHIRIRIASPYFLAQSKVVCHRLVYDVLQPYLEAGLHAVAIEILPNPKETTD